MAPINYAEAYGYSSLAAAIVFAVAYLPLAGWFIFQAITSFTGIWVTMTLFCLGMSLPVHVI